MRSPRILGATGAVLALTVIQAMGMGGCDLSYLTEGTGASTTGTTTTSSTGGAGGATTSPTGGAGGTTTSSTGGAGGTTSTGGTGGAPEPTALVFSRGFGDPTINDDVAPADNTKAPSGAIVVAPMAGGAMFVAFHAAGSNVLVAGKPYPKDPATGADIFLAVIDGEGTLVTSRHLSMPDEQTVLSVAAAGPGGPFYLGGQTGGAVVLPDDLGGITTTNPGVDGYILKIEADLTISAAALWMGTGSQRVQSLFVDATGALWMGGQSTKVVQAYAPTPGTGQTSIGSCGAADYVPKAGKAGGFVARMSADLSSCTRVFTFGLDASVDGTVNVDVNGIAVDADQNLYVAGRFQGTLTVDAAPPITSPVEAGYAVKVAASGGAHWSTAFRGSSYPNTLWSVAVAGDRAIVTGQGGPTPIFSRAVPGAAQKDGETCLLNAVGALDGTIVGLAKDSGACIEAGRLGGVAGSTEKAFDAVVQPSGEVWVTGVFDTKLLVNGSLPNMFMDQGANIESFALRLAPNGLASAPPDIPFAQAWGGLRDQTARHLTVLSDGRVAVVGSYTGIFPAGAPDVQEGSPPDYFLLVLDPTLPIQPF